MEELKKLVELFEASKTEHELPNDNTAEYNEGYVKAMNIAMNRVKDLSLFSVSQQRELLIAFYRSIDNGDYLYPEDCKYHVDDFLESN